MVTPGRHFSFFQFLPCLIFVYIHAMVLIYIPKCSPFNILYSGVFSLATHAFVYELHVEIYRI